MARMEMDCNNFFSEGPHACVEKSLKTDLSLFFLGEVISYFAPGVLTIKKGFFVKCLPSSFSQHTAKSSRQWRF